MNNENMPNFNTTPAQKSHEPNPAAFEQIIAPSETNNTPPTPQMEQERENLMSSEQAAPLPPPPLPIEMPPTEKSLTQTPGATPEQASDSGTIEKAWVNYRQKMIRELQNDPHKLEDEYWDGNDKYTDKRFNRQLGDRN